MPTPSPEAWAQMRHDYEHTEKPVDEICAEHGISSGTLRDRVRRWNWTQRRVPIALEGPPSLAAPQLVTPPLVVTPLPFNEAAAPPALAPHAADAAQPPAQAAAEVQPVEDAAAPTVSNPATMAARLHAAVARVLPAIGTTLAKLTTTAHPREMESAGRALSSLTRTLRELNTLLSENPVRGQCDCCHEIEDIDAFRLDLARRIEAFVASRSNDEAGGAAQEIPLPERVASSASTAA